MSYNVDKILRLPLINRAVTKHLEMLDLVNLSIALSDYDELQYQLRTNVVPCYQLDDENNFVNHLFLSFLTKFDERVDEAFLAFPFLQDIRVQFKHPRRELLPLFGLAHTSFNEKPTPRRCNVTLEMNFVFNDTSRTPEYLPRVVDFFEDYFLQPRITIHADLTTLKEEPTGGRILRNSIHCFENHAFLSKTFSRRFIDSNFATKWSIVLLDPFASFSVEREEFCDLFAPMRLFDFLEIDSDQLKEVNIHDFSSLDTVPPLMRRANFLTFDVDDVPEQFRPIIAHHNSLRMLIDLTKECWSSIFYEPLLLLRTDEYFPPSLDRESFPYYKKLVHVRYTSDKKIVLSKNVVFCKNVETCTEKLITCDRATVDCDDVGIALFLNSCKRRLLASTLDSNESSDTFFIPANARDGLYHIFSHHPIVNPFSLESNTVSGKRSLEEPFLRNKKFKLSE